MRKINKVYMLLICLAFIVSMFAPMTFAATDPAAEDVQSISPMAINAPVADVVVPAAQPWYNQAFAGEPAGFRPDKVPAAVTLTGPENASIFFTKAVVDVADGAAPSQEQVDALANPTALPSLLYTGPISLADIDATHAVVIKALSFTTTGGADISDVVTFTYFQRLWVLTDVKTLKDGTLNNHTQKVPNEWTSFVLDQVVNEMTQDELATMTGGSVNGQEYSGMDNPFRGAPTTTNGTINSNPNRTGWTDVRMNSAATGTDLGISRLCIPTTIMTDGPAGVRNGRNATAWVVATALASAWDTEVQHNFASRVATEAAYTGYDMMLAPAFNIHRSPMGGRNFEYYSEDPYISYKNALVYTDAMLEKRIGVSLKHYMGNDQENNRNNVSTTVSERALREIMGYPFMRVTEESDPYALMSIYGIINQTRASDHHWMVDQLPREQWGFQGFVQTDWGNHWDAHSMAARLNQHQSGNNYAAGNNFMNFENGVNATDGLVSPESKEIRMKIMRRNCKDILTSVIKMPIFNNMYDDLTSAITQQRQTEWYTNPESPQAESARLNRDLAAKCFILLKNNEVNNVPALPLTGASKKNLTIVYSSSVPNSLQGNVDYVVQGGGSGQVTWNRATTGTIRNALISEEFGYAVPNYIRENDALLDADNVAATAAAYAASTDVGIMIISRTSGEGSDPNLANFDINANEKRVLPALYNAFKAVNKPFIVITNMGGNISTTEIREYSDAILHISAAGEMGGWAVADVLSGKVNPSGKTVDSWPLTFDDSVPRLAAAYFTEKGMMDPSLQDYVWASSASFRTAVYAEDNLVGYRFYETIAAIDPDFKMEDHVAFPFGFGLSYTEFEYSDIKLDKTSVSTANSDTVKATVTVTNTGTVAGRTAVELYIGADSFKEEGRPVRELKNYGMTKVLQPGEKQDVSFTIEKRDLCYFDDGSTMANNYGKTWKPWQINMSGTGLVNDLVDLDSDPKFAAYANLQLWGTVENATYNPSPTDPTRLSTTNLGNGGYGRSEELNQMGYTRTSLDGVDAYTTYNGFYGDNGHKTGWRVDPGTIFTVQIGDSSSTKDLAERGVSATFTYGDYASISAPEIADAVSQKLSYDIGVGEVTNANLFEITAQFDPGLVYEGSVINLPASFNASFLSRSFDSATGLFKATIALMKAGPGLSTKDLKSILTVSFGFGSAGEAADKSIMEACLVSVGIYELQGGGDSVIRVDAGFKPASANTTIRTYKRFDIASPAGVGNEDISLIIYRYYMMMAGDPGWAEVNAKGWAPAKEFDADANDIVNMGDILIINTYAR